MGFWSAYRASLKPLEVEEPIDVWVHRPLAYIFARACFRLPISPDLVTAPSIVAGLSSAASLVAEFPHHLQVGGGLLFASAILDCADGQLARMRGTSSLFGRMLDDRALAALLKRVVGPNETLKPEHLVPAPPRIILVRMLTNLKTVYLARGEDSRRLLALVLVRHSRAFVSMRLLSLSISAR